MTRAVEKILEHQKPEHLVPYYPMRPGHVAPAKKKVVRPNILALAADIAIRVVESQHVVLTEGVTARWIYNQKDGSSRTIHVTLVTKGGTEEAIHIYSFDGPTIVADWETGVDLLDKYRDLEEVKEASPEVCRAEGWTK